MSKDEVIIELNQVKYRLVAARDKNMPMWCSSWDWFNERFNRWQPVINFKRKAQLSKVYELMKNTMGYSKEWQDYRGDYDKLEYDIQTKDGMIYESCYPNAGFFNPLGGDKVSQEDVVKIRLSANQRLHINPDELYNQ